MSRAANFGLLILVCAAALLPAIAEAGMPAPLPTGWTVDGPHQHHGGGDHPGAADAHWQAISFFVACLLLSAWGVKLLWNTLQREFTWLPRIGYGRALSLVVLWGLAFVVVLTIISGARELMTPGAWRKQGWTYRLADEPAQSNSRETRRKALEELRQQLWHYAATHSGQFPQEHSEFDPSLWRIPGWGELRFMYRPGEHVDDSGRLLAFEPELADDERLVLLTNGLIGTMRTAEIDRLLDREVAR